MNLLKSSLFWKHAGGGVLVAFSTLAAQAQTMSDPIKQGLWESQMTMSMQMTLPPDVEARIAAMPQAQQAQVRSMMGGAGGGAPTTSTNKSCVAQTTTVDDLLNQGQQKAGMKCTYSNRQQTASSVSFDVSCGTPQGTATGHMKFVIADSEHGTSTTHMTSTMSQNGKTVNMAMDATSTFKYLGADCGDVKPYAPAATAH